MHVKKGQTAQGTSCLGNRRSPQLLLGGEGLGASCLAIAGLCDGRPGWEPTEAGSLTPTLSR